MRKHTVLIKSADNSFDTLIKPLRMQRKCKRCNNMTADVTTLKICKNEKPYERRYYICRECYYAIINLPDHYFLEKLAK